jgi:tetratricopeptide (TPR) repeat protein
MPLATEVHADHHRHRPDHPDTLASANNLAYAYRAAGRLDEAIPLYEQALADYRRVLGDNHPNTLTSANNLVGAYLAAGRLDEALMVTAEAKRTPRTSKDARSSDSGD